MYTSQVCDFTGKPLVSWVDAGSSGVFKRYVTNLLQLAKKKFYRVSRYCKKLLNFHSQVFRNDLKASSGQFRFPVDKLRSSFKSQLLLEPARSFWSRPCRFCRGCCPERHHGVRRGLWKGREETEGEVRDTRCRDKEMTMRCDREAIRDTIEGRRRSNWRMIKTQQRGKPETIERW